jgi:hypothetical protein
MNCWGGLLKHWYLFPDWEVSFVPMGLSGSMGPVPSHKWLGYFQFSFLSHSFYQDPTCAALGKKSA